MTKKWIKGESSVKAWSLGTVYLQHSEYKRLSSFLPMIWDKHYKTPTAYDRRRSANNLGLLLMHKLNVLLKLPCHRPCGVNVQDVILSLSRSLSPSLFICNYCIFWWRCAGVIYAVILETVYYLSFWNLWTTKCAFCTYFLHLYIPLSALNTSIISLSKKK